MKDGFINSFEPKKSPVKQVFDPQVEKMNEYLKFSFDGFSN